MTHDLPGKKVVVTGEKHSVGRAIAEAVAGEGAHVVIWLRKCNDEVNEGKVLPITLLEIPSQLPNGGSANLALAPNNGAQILLVIRLGNARTSRLLSKIFGIKMHRIGKERCEAICQAPKQNQNKTILLCNLKSITPTITTLKKQNHPKQQGRSQRPIDSPGDPFFDALGWAQPFLSQEPLY